MAVSDKTSRTSAASYTPSMVPDFPRASPTLLETPGFQEQEVRYQQWWDDVKQSLFKTSQGLGINISRGSASVLEEATIRAEHDGFLEGKYTLTVAVGDVVTGMTITSSTAPDGGTVSDVTFQADRFQIYSGTTKKIMFDADSGLDVVRLGGVLTVDTAAGSVYVKTTSGAGAWGDADTPFYVDADGNFSLRDKVIWDDASSSLVLLADGVYIGMLPEGGDSAANQIEGQMSFYNFHGASAFGTTNIQTRVAGGTQASKSAAGAGSNFGMNGRVWDGSTWQDYGRISWTTLNAASTNRASVFDVYTKTTGGSNNYIEFDDLGRLCLTSAASPTLLSGRINIQSPGTTAAGGIYFDTDTTLYRNAANSIKTDDSLTVAIDLTVMGSATFSSGWFAVGSCTLSSGSLSTDGVVLGNGSTGTPSLRFSSDTDTGWRWNSSGDMRGVTNGADRLVVRDGAIVCLVPLKLDNSYVATPPTCTGYVNITDGAGTVYKVLVGT
jgi:hypothetical protein